MEFFVIIVKAFYEHVFHHKTFKKIKMARIPQLCFSVYLSVNLFKRFWEDVFFDLTFKDADNKFSK